MKILVSGATGFIGKHLILRLKKERYIIRAVVRPSTDVRFLRKQKIKSYVFNEDVPRLISFMKKERFAGVVHLASVFLAQHTPEDIKRLTDANVFFATALLEASAQSKTPWFINTGTFWQHYNNKVYSPVNLYAATKQAFEDIARYYLESSSINFVTLKLSDTFGPSDTRTKLLNLWSNAARSKTRLDMSPGKQRIDISYVDNVIDGYTRLMTLLSRDSQRALAGKSFAIRSGKVRTLRQLAKIFERVTKTHLDIRWGGKTYRPREVMIPWNKGKRIPGWKPRISLAEGIKRTFHG